MRFQMKATLLIGVLFLFQGMVFSAAGQGTAKSRDRDRGRMMLNAIKSGVKKDYYDPNFHGLDLEARFKEADEKIKQAESWARFWASSRRP